MQDSIINWIQSNMKRIKLVLLLNIIVIKSWAMTRSELDEFSDFLEKTSQLDLNLKSKCFKHFKP